MRQVRENRMQNRSSNACHGICKRPSKVNEGKVHCYRVGQVSRVMQTKPITDTVLCALAG